MPVQSMPKSIRTEMETVDSMIQIYCSDLHSRDSLCVECAELKNYALLRLEYCRFGAAKPTCVKCPVHCYKPDMKERIRGVMRYAGPKMMIRHPWLAMVHLWKEFGVLRPAPQIK